MIMLSEAENNSSVGCLLFSLSLVIKSRFVGTFFFSKYLHWLAIVIILLSKRLLIKKLLAIPFVFYHVGNSKNTLKKIIK